MESPLLGLPVGEFGALIIVQMGTIGHIPISNLATNLHPLREDLLGDEVQRQAVLRQGEVDLKDLLLEQHRLLRLLGEEAHHQLVDHGQQEVHRLVEGRSLLAALVLIGLHQLVHGHQGAVPPVDILILQIDADVVHHLGPSSREVTLDDVIHADRELNS